jgi:type 1 glutamine amidotransferase
MVGMIRRRPVPLILLLATLAGAVAIAAPKRVLVYTRNYTPDGKGYVHDNIATSVEAIRKMVTEHGLEVDSTDDPKVFTRDNLKRYDVLVFSNTNNEAFENDAQRKAFRQYIESGGGFAGIHSASGSERNWPYFWSVVGGKFLRHPKLQKFTIRVVDSKHPATQALPATFDWEDECYYLDNMEADLHVLLVTDPAKLDDPRKTEYPSDRFGDSLPLAWVHKVGRGRAFYSALGHKKEHYSDPLFTKHLLGGILWAAGVKTPRSLTSHAQ